MKIEVIPDELADELLTAKEPTKREYPVPAQHGPLRYFDVPGRCASRGCSSPTHYKVGGIRYCMTHALRRLNEMLIELGIDK